MDQLCPCCLKREPFRDRLCFPCQFEKPERIRWYSLRPMPAEPTASLPQSREKVEVFVQRRAVGCCLHHPRDARYAEAGCLAAEIRFAAMLERIALAAVESSVASVIPEPELQENVA